jgi:hypothetical protein
MSSLEWTTNEPQMHIGFCLLVAAASPKLLHPRSSTCICDQKSRSPELSSSVILHRERANKIFGKRSSWLFARLFKFFITARLPLHWTRVKGHHLQRELRQAQRRLHPIVVIKESQVIYNFSSQIISYILNIFIYVDIILLDNLL